MLKTRNKRKQLIIALGFVAPFFLLYGIYYMAGYTGCLCQPAQVDADG